MKKIIQQAVDDTMNSGANACDVLVNIGNSMNLSAQEGKLEKFKISHTAIIGVRVIKDKRIGLSYSESFDEDAIHFAIKNALENAEYSDINEFETIQIKNSHDFIQENPPEEDCSSIEEKIEFALKLESEVKRKDSRVQAVPYNSLSIAKSKSYYLNSLGTYTEENSHFLSAYTSALLKVDGSTSTHAASILGLTLKHLNLDQCVDECLEHASNWLNAKPVPTNKYDVIFDTNIISDILNAFSNCFSAKAAIDKINFWENKIDKTVASSNFTLIDSPLYNDAFLKFPVDKEGMLKKDLTLIENGILKSFYHNTATADYFGLTSTGHASRGARSSLEVSSTNWLIKPGTNTISEVLDDTYLEIIDAMGIFSGCDSISGDFSFGASGYLCKNGKRIQPVKGITIAGNFNRLLSEIACIGTELKSNHARNTFSPLIRFTKLSVAGK